MMRDMLQHASVVALLGFVVSLVPVGLGFLYAYRPTERTLALLRPFTLAALFGGLSSFTLGLTSILRGIAATPSPITNWQLVAAGLGESVLALVVAFGSLTVAWLLVALGLRRIDPHT